MDEMDSPVSNMTLCMNVQILDIEKNHVHITKMGGKYISTIT